MPVTEPALPAPQPLRVLIIEDSEDAATALLHTLQRSGYAPHHERLDSRAALEQALARKRWDIVVSDYEMPGFGGLQALALVKEREPDLPFIVLSGAVGEETAADAMRQGAHDFVMKGNTARLIPAIQRELRDAAVRRERAAEHRRVAHLERRLAAERLVVKRMRELDRVKDHFVETVTHELRTPMAPLRSAIELLLDGLVGAITPQQRDMLELMQRNVERLSRFATDILLLSRIESGNHTLQGRPTSLHDALLPVVEHFRVKAAEEQKTVALAVPPELHAFADSDAVAQVITNLLSNALVHTGPATVVRISAQLAGEYVAVTVSDNGGGIPPEALPKVFDRFYQAARRSGPGYRGIGLGLSICKALVERMGGTIGVESEVGKGATFVFTLPSGPRPAPPARAARKGTGSAQRSGGRPAKTARTEASHA